MAVTDAGGSSTGEHRSVPGRRAGRALMLLMLPFVVVGAALTVSLYGAFLGLPLLLVSWMAFRAGRRASRDPEDLATLKRLARDAAVAGALALGLAPSTSRRAAGATEQHRPAPAPMAPQALRVAQARRACPMVGT